jgi:putative phage-type endonuclease
MNFPDCEIHHMPQRSPEWFDIRAGVLTASMVGAWIMSEKTQRDKDARESAICRLIASEARAWEARLFETDAMKRGTEFEPLAVESFEKSTGKKITDVGFCRSKHGRFGCSPDGLILEDGTGFEGKVPEPKKHIQYRRAGELPSEYHWQVQMSMAVTGARAWWFQAFNPGLAPFRILVHRSSETDDLLAALTRFSVQVDAALREEAEAWIEAEKRGEIIA